MTHYEKLATLVIRLIASTATTSGLLGLGMVTIQEHSLNVPFQFMPPSVYLLFLLYVILGIIAYIISPLLGRFIGKGL